MGAWTLQDQAARQGGRIAWWQLAPLGVPRGRAQRWIASGRLIPTLPSVYAVGVPVDHHVARLWDAILYAGPGAMLSHITAGHLRGWLQYPPRAGVIQVSTPRRIRALTRAGIEVHARRALTHRDTFGGFPVTSTAQTLLDIGDIAGHGLVRRALGVLDYRRELDLRAIVAATGRGISGSAAVNLAAFEYDPDFARLNDEAEIDFFDFLRSSVITPMPEFNAPLERNLVVDALWRAHGLGTEVDGGRNHSSRPQLLRDARRDVRCRTHGIDIIRYRPAQIRHEPQLVRADLKAALARRARERGL